MTIVKIGRKEDKQPMEFEFHGVMDAYVFYATAKDTYREDDMEIVMTEEGDTEL